MSSEVINIPVGKNFQQTTFKVGSVTWLTFMLFMRACGNMIAELQKWRVKEKENF